MSKIKVYFTVAMTQVIEWPDDELDDLNYDNVHVNLDTDKAKHNWNFDITNVTKNGEDLDF